MELRFSGEPGAVEMAQYFWYLNCNKAARELAFKPRDPGETLHDTVTYLRENFLGGDALESNATSQPCARTNSATGVESTRFRLRLARNLQTKEPLQEALKFVLYTPVAPTVCATDSVSFAVT